MAQRSGSGNGTPSHGRTAATTVEEAREANRRHWSAVYEAAGIKLSGQSYEWADGKGRPMAGAGHPIIAWASDGIGIGDLVVQWDGHEPTRVNQCVYRVGGFGVSGSPDLVGLIPGPIVPRSEWPAALREATAPTYAYVERIDTHVSVRDCKGKELFSYRDRPARIEEHLDRLAKAIEAAADIGREDALADVERRFELRKGSGGPSRDRSYWQLVSDAGTVVDIEPRGITAFAPSHFAQAVLAATRAAYADGLWETFDAQVLNGEKDDLPSLV